MEWSELFRIWVIVCPLVFIGGVVDSVAGGGGLITLPAYLLAGLPAHNAAATNKCGNAFGTFLATGRFLKRGQVHMPSAIAGGIGALVGAWVGAKLNMIMPEQVLYYLLLAVLPAMPQMAAGIPMAHSTLPARAKVTRDAKLLAELATFVFPEAVSRSNLQSPVKASIRKVPAPGPKKPS